MLVFKFRDNAYLRLLTCWLKHAKNSADDLSTGNFWAGGEYGESAEETYAHSIGRLRKLESMPELIKPLFTTVGEEWSLTIRHFSLAVKNELLRVRRDAPFSMIYSFYKSAGACSDRLPGFLAKVHLAQMLLKKRHGKCRCRWGRREEGWGSVWTKTEPDGWPYWGVKCPYELAIDDLDHGWGHPDRTLSCHQAGNKEKRLCALSRVLRDAGIVEYTPTANLSLDGHFYTYPQFWPRCEWKTTLSLIELMNTVAEFEIDTAVRKRLNWLVAIEKGEKPFDLDMPAECVRLCETDRGLSLIKWSPQVAS